MKSSTKRIFYNDQAFQILRNVYEPAEDTFLAADNLIVNEHDQVLDIGTGCGILAIIAAIEAKSVVAVDINPHAIRCARKNAETNNVPSKIDIRKGDLFEPIRKSERFSLIVFNAPYLPSSKREARTWMGKAWAGGPTGRELIDRFVAEAPQHLKKNGKILLVQSSLTNVDETLKKLESTGFEAKVIAEKKVNFETIVLIKAKPFIHTAQ